MRRIFSAATCALTKRQRGARLTVAADREYSGSVSATDPDLHLDAAKATEKFAVNARATAPACDAAAFCRALLTALAEFPRDAIPADTRAALARGLLTRYREDPDSGLHSAIDRLLSQQWEWAGEVARADAELAKETRAGGPVAVGWDWYVSGERQTFAVVRRPALFQI